MSVEKTFKIKFTYLHELFSGVVYREIYPNGYTLYKVVLKAARYWFLNKGEEWKVIADFKLNRRLEGIIIKKLEKVDL